MASPVFKAMLATGRFEEASQLQESGAAEVRLPDDDLVDVLVLCRILHFQNDKVPGLIDVQKMGNFAQLVDEYDAVRATQPPTEAWLRKEMSMVQDADRARLLHAAYHFQSSQISGEIGQCSNKHLWPASKTAKLSLQTLPSELEDSRLRSGAAIDRMSNLPSCNGNCVCYYCPLFESPDDELRYHAKDIREEMSTVCCDCVRAEKRVGTKCA